jgi:preprotein translocase subunit SecD
MLHFSRAKAAAILLTALVTCGFMVPNFLSDETMRSWPVWAQRRLVLGPDLQGGTSLRLEADRNDLRRQLLTSLRRDVRNALHEARIDLVSPLAVRGGSVEVRPLEPSFQAGLAKLGELSQTFNGVRPVDVVDAGGGLIRVTPTDAALAERERQVVDMSIQIIRARMLVDATVRREGSRIMLQMPGIGDPRRLGTIPGMGEI